MRRYLMSLVGIAIFVASIVFYHYATGSLPSISGDPGRVSEIVLYQDLLALLIVAPGTLFLFMNRFIEIYFQRRIQFDWLAFMIHFIPGAIILFSVSSFYFLASFYDVPFIEAFAKYRILGAVLIAIGVVQSLNTKTEVDVDEL